MKQKYGNKPVVVEAVQYKGMLTEELRNFIEFADYGWVGRNEYNIESFVILTPDGNMEVAIGDYIIKNADGEFYPCRPDSFEKIYEKVCKDGANPQNLYVYFKAEEDQAEALKKFRDSFQDQFGDFRGDLADANDLLGALILYLRAEGNKGLKTVVEEYRLRIKTLEKDMPDGWLPEIIDLYEKIMKYSEIIYGQDSEEYVSSLLSAGNYLRTAAQYHKALEVEEKALEIAERIFEGNHPTTATAYNNVGLIRGDLGDYGKSLKYLLKALKIRENILGENHPETASTYNNIGFTYGKLLVRMFAF